MQLPRVFCCRRWPLEVGHTVKYLSDRQSVTIIVSVKLTLLTGFNVRNMEVQPIIHTEKPSNHSTHDT